MQRLSITKGHAFILVYSVCSKQSLEELKPIWNLIKELKVLIMYKILEFMTTSTINETYICMYLCIYNMYNGDMYSQGPDIENIPVMLVGNKCDESDELRNVSEMEGKAQAESWKVSFMETSAKTNHNVTELFQVRFYEMFI